MKICVACSAENADSAARCRVCNGMFFAAAAYSCPETTSQHTELVCAGCGRPVSAAALVCPHCGHSVEASKRAARERYCLKLTHASGAQLLAADGDVLGRMFVGKELFQSDDYVSAAHIRVNQSGRRFTLTDISGGNSFFVNMQPVDVGGSAAISGGEVVKIGTTDLTAEIFSADRAAGGERDVSV